MSKTKQESSIIPKRKVDYSGAKSLVLAIGMFTAGVLTARHQWVYATLTAILTFSIRGNLHETE